MPVVERSAWLPELLVCLDPVLREVCELNVVCDTVRNLCWEAGFCGVWIPG